MGRHPGRIRRRPTAMDGDLACRHLEFNARDHQILVLGGELRQCFAIVLLGLPAHELFDRSGGRFVDLVIQFDMGSPPFGAPDLVADAVQDRGLEVLEKATCPAILERRQAPKRTNHSFLHEIVSVEEVACWRREAPASPHRQARTESTAEHFDRYLIAGCRLLDQRVRRQGLLPRVLGRTIQKETPPKKAEPNKRAKALAIWWIGGYGKRLVERFNRLRGLFHPSPHDEALERSRELIPVFSEKGRGPGCVLKTYPAHRAYLGEFDNLVARHQSALARDGGLMLKFQQVLCVCSGIFAFALASTTTAHATFTSWTSVDLSGNVAQGSMGPVTVTVSGGDLSFFQQASTGFNDPTFCPPLPTADLLELIATPTGHTYTITFSKPVHNPILHVRSLASTLTFSGETLIKLCGQQGFSASGNQVSGINCMGGGAPPVDSDYNGTVRVHAWVNQLTFTAVFDASRPDCVGASVDGFHLQIGAESTPCRP